ncbi:MAG: TonB-dependent receptor [Halioglobus sp.]|nr:TonB-dependent receptor [Halioglobus sp.]
MDRNLKCCAPDARHGDSVNEQLIAEGFEPDNNDPFDRETAVSIEQDFRSEFTGLSLIIDYERDWGAFKSITNWTDSEGGNSFDPDRSELDVMSFVDSFGATDTLSQELRVTFDQGDDFEHMLGFFYFESTTKGGDGKPFVFLGEDFLTQGNQQQAFLDTLPAPLDFLARPGDSLRAKSSIDTTTVAVFGQSTWNITDAWRVTGGLRWTDEEKDADLFTEINSTAPSAALTGQSFLTSVSTPIDDSFTRSTNDVTWLIKTSYDVLADTMLWASVATGSKSGGFNTVNGTPEEREFEDEDTTSYEAGIKSTSLDARLRVNAALFYTRIDDFQFQQQLETGIGTRVSNQAEVETMGLDMEIQARPLSNLTLTAGLLYMDKFEIVAGPQEGDDLPYTADYSFNLSATLVFPLADGGVYLRADYSYMGDHATSGSADLRDDQIDNREDLNAKLGWRNENWNVSVWGKNLTDDQYKSFTADRFPVTSTDAFWLAPPRTFGATLRYELF